MPSPGGQFFSDEFGDIEDYFVSDYQLIDQYIGDTLWSWGSNIFGTLGINFSTAATTYRSTPVTTLLGGTNWKSVASSGYHTAAIKTDGSLWIWGRNDFGQLGTNNDITRSTPVTTFAGGTNWKSVASGYAFTSAIKTDGTLWTWGNNDDGQLGVNNNIIRNTPTQVFGNATNWKSVSCGFRCTVAIKTDGTLWTWGKNSYGQLGVNDTTNRSTPVTTLLGGTNWKSVASGYAFTSAIKTDGTLWVWGSNLYAQLGVNDITHRSTPVTTLLGGNTWKSIACGNHHTIALKTDGTLWSWGYNIFGQLGVNDTTDRSTPVTTLLGGTNWKYVDGGSGSTAASKTDGTLWLSGNNTAAQLGIRDTTNRNTPVTTLLGGTNWKFFSCGQFNTVAVTAGVDIDPSDPTEIIFDQPGTYSWTAPVGITSVSVVCVGGGGGSAQSANGASGAGGGGLGWKNNISVSPGTAYTVVVGSGGTKVTGAGPATAGAGGTSYFISTNTVAGFGGGGGQAGGDTVGAGGTYFGDGGGNGGAGGTRGTSTADAGGGGGAGGYSGNGGAGGAVVAGAGQNGAAGTGGGGGGGGGCGSADTAGCGGGVGLNGQGSNGNGGAGSSSDGAGGFGGSGGANASQASAIAPGNVYSTTVPSIPGSYGGGGCGSDLSSTASAETTNGASGAVRIVWSGLQFP